MPKDRDQHHADEAAALIDHAPTVERGVLHLPLTRFRDTEDTIPQPQRLSWPDWVKLLAPEQPPIREDLAREVRRREALLSDLADAVLTGRDPGPTLARHPWFRILEREAHQAQDREAAVKARCIPMRDAIRRQAKTRLPCWSPALYRPHATRGLLGVLCLSALVLDHDDGLSIDEALRPWRAWPLLLHTSWSHRAEHPRFRVVLPLDRPVPVSAWPRVWRWAFARAAFRIDAACKDPSRIWLLPAKPSARSAFEALVHDPGGELLDVDWRTLAPAPEEQPQRPLAKGEAPPMVRRLLRSSREHRERAARILGARLTGRRAESMACPACGRISVWFWLEPGAQDGARCQHQRSCGWFGSLDELLRRRGDGNEQGVGGPAWQQPG